MDYLEPAEARQMDGLRLALTAPRPMPEGLRTMYEAVANVLGDWKPILIEQRDRVLAEHDLPMDF